jgi:hypothetical protein
MYSQLTLFVVLAEAFVDQFIGSRLHLVTNIAGFSGAGQTKQRDDGEREKLRNVWVVFLHVQKLLFL